MTIRIHHVLFGAALLASAACGKKSENPPATGSGAPVATGSGSGSAMGSGSGMAMGSDSMAAGSGSAAEAAPVDIPTEVDFEAEAATTVTEKNLKDQVKTLETTLSGT